MISGNDKYMDFIPSCSYSGNAHARDAARDARKKEKECCKLLARVEELEDKLRKANEITLRSKCNEHRSKHSGR